MRYLAELYLPPPAEDELARLSARMRTAADELAREGAPVRYIEAIVVPEDEMCLLVYEAESPELVREAGARAGIACERVLETTHEGGATP